MTEDSSNQKIAVLLSELAVLLEIAGVPFKPQVYERAAHSIEAFGQDLNDVYNREGIKGLRSIEGVGEGIALKIEEFLKTGRIADFEKLAKKYPPGVSKLTRIEGIGPHTAKQLYDELGIKSIEELAIAAKAGKLRSVKGLGERSEARILKSIQYIGENQNRFILGYKMPLILNILNNLRKNPGVIRAEIAGSVRRMQETVGNFDFVIIAKNSENVAVDFPNVNLHFTTSQSWGTSLQYYTGSKEHNSALEVLAKQRNYKLTNRATEEEIYSALGLKWIPPELRVNKGEIETSRLNKLPTLISYKDLKGDLQTQTDWTDGKHSIKQMAEAAKKIGLEYIAITDHTHTLKITNGNDDKRLLAQMEEIDRVQKEVGGIKILKGAEVNILADGSLDISDEVLAKLDVVGASVHSLMKKMSEAEMTNRITRAMENPHVDIIFHPTGRIISRREPYPVNMTKLIETAKRTGTILEANAWPDRLDLKDIHIKQAIESGVKISIDSDAHATEHFAVLEFGIAQARRGWARKSDVINAWPWEEMKKMLK